MDSVNSLGGSNRPAFALTQVGLDTPPGDYKLTVTVKDRAANKSASFTYKFQVAPLQLLHLTSENELGFLEDLADRLVDLLLYRFILSFQIQRRNHACRPLSILMMSVFRPVPADEQDKGGSAGSASRQCSGEHRRGTSIFI